MKLKEIMTSPVESIEPIATVREAALRMKKADVGMLPVVFRDEVIGVLTDRDLVVRALADDIPGKTVRQIMTRDPICLHEERSVEDAIDQMSNRKVGRVIVTDDRGHAVGVLSSADIAFACAGQDCVGKLAAALSHSHHAPSRVLAT
jgi:CBS domain-containing protein